MPKTAKKETKETAQFSVTFSTATAEVINEMVKMPEYRNNRSFAIETLITSSAAYKRFVKNKK